MSLNIDSTIFLVFIIVNLVVGLFYGFGIKNIKEYAIGNRNFSTMTIAATLVATWISGSTFFTNLSQTYNNGLYYIWAITGASLGLLLIAWFFAPRLSEFMGKISIAEAMGDLFGKKVRIITAISGCIGTTGIMAAQLKVSGLLFEYSFGVPGVYGVLIGSAIVAIYTTFGGIKSVTFTDVIQLFTFGTVIPTLAFFIFANLDSIDVVTDNIKNNPIFDYKEVFDFSNPKAFTYLFLFFIWLAPGFEPAIFQRISMAKNTLQVRNSFVIASVTCLTIIFIMSFISILILSTNPGLSSKDLLKFVIFEYSYTGFRGLTLIGIMAMVMSTVDSYINSTAVLFIHDICKPLKIKFNNNELTATRIASFVITLIALILALSSDNLLKLMISGASFYMPVVTVPFIMALCGFRSTAKSVLIAMFAGIFTVILWMIFLPDCNIDSLIPAMFVNLVFLLGSHYLLRQSGGWVGIQDEVPLQELRKQRKIFFYKFFKMIVEFKLFKFLQKNTPTAEYTYVSVSLFCIISIFATIYAIPKEVQNHYKDLIGFIFPSSLILTTLLMSYPLWPKFLREKNVIVVIWNLVVFYILVCSGFLFVIISNFAPTQMMIFMVNLIILAVVVRWKLALLLMIMGIFITTKLFKIYIGEAIITENLLSFKFEVSYVLLLMSAIMVAFFKPQQEKQELADEKIDLLGEQAYDREDELKRLLKLKSEFLNNLSHEIRTPITGVVSLSQSLYELYDELNESQRLEITRSIAKNSKRLNSLMENILDLSKLSSFTYELNLTYVNLSTLLYNRLDVCKRLYLNNKEIEFITNIEPNIVINCDEHYIKSTLDNLIINAITYSKEGKIIINLNKRSKIHFSIKDEGIGINKLELRDIFDAFVVGSKTSTNAGGRGVGLALCLRAIKLHGGNIWAESDGRKGSIFCFDLPIEGVSEV